MRLPANWVSGFCVALTGFAVASCAPLPALSGTVSPASTDRTGGTASRTMVNGPEADYPVVLGEPFTIDGITYTPEDTLNYDEVGYATIDDPQESGVTAAHRTLPLPSYVEVTSLESGKTVLVRVERRGPMVGSRLIALSRGALAQLGAGEASPVRVRRVNPPEEHRAELRAGLEAPLRMETPEGLLGVLRRKLPAVGSAPLRDDRAPTTQVAAANTAQIPATPSQKPATIPKPAGVPADDEVTGGSAAAKNTDSAATPTSVRRIPTSTDGRFVVQAGAFSSRAAADRVAENIGGYVESVGRLWRVRSGPYATRGQANAALANVRGAGYRGAQVYTVR